MRLIIFDLDGTLIDSAQMILAAQGRAFAALGLPVPPDSALLGVVGLSLPETFLTLCGQDAPIEALADAYKAAWRQLLDEGRAPMPYAGADALVRTLAARTDVILGIATGKTRKGVDDLIVQFGWEGLFAAVQTADSAPSKPHPGMVLQALAQTGVAASDCVMIGDTSFDMDMARDAGVRSVAVTWGFHDHVDIAHADIVVDDFDGLLRALA